MNPWRTKEEQEHEHRDSKETAQRPITLMCVLPLLYLCPALVLPLRIPCLHHPYNSPKRPTEDLPGIHGIPVYFVMNSVVLP